jgi:phenylacetate-coenzyme A ligase PaaK-like adenylate-forming protein
MTATPTIERPWSREQLLAYQRDRLEALLRHAVDASPYYREVLGPHPDAGWLEELPTLSKATLMAEFDRIVTDPAVTRSKLERLLEQESDGVCGTYRFFSTSGTTGEPALLVYSQDEFAHWVGVTMRTLAEAGVTPETRLVGIGAPNPLHISRRLVDAIRAVRGGDMPKLYVTTPLAELVEALNEHRPEAIVTYSSVAGLLADEQLDGRLRIRPTFVLVTSEVLTEHAERRIREAWGVAPTQLYASTEAPVLACGRSGGLCIREDEIVLEVVDGENRPLPPGTPGDKVLLTNLVNRTQPLIRYELGDSVELADGSAADGSAFRRIARIQGRTEEILRLRTPDGGEIAVHPYLLHDAFTPFAQLAQYQIVHDEQRLRARIVLRRSAPPDTAERVRDALRSAVQAAGAVPPAVEVEQVERIERDRGPAAKAKLIAAVAAVVAAAAFVGSASARTTFSAGDYVGSLRGSHSFLALVLGERGGVRAYVSDAHKVAEWFEGNAGNGGLSATSKHGYRLRLAFAHGRAFGTVRFPSGAVHPFSARSVAGPGRLFRIVLGPPERPYLGGWIVWSPGEALGRVVPSPSTQVERGS